MADKKLVSIQGGKGAEEVSQIAKEEAYVVINGQKIDLDSFILCGTAIEGEDKNRVVLTWNSSVDEMVIYKSTLNIAIEDKLRASLRGEKKFNVYLTFAGDLKSKVIKVIREATGLALKEVKELVENTPNPRAIIEGVSVEEAEDLKGKLEEVGASVQVNLV